MGEREEPNFVIEPLGAKHDRAAFSCGNDELDSYLHKQAGQDLKKRAAVPFVITPDHKTIFKRRIREITRPAKGVSIKTTIAESR